MADVFEKTEVPPDQVLDKPKPLPSQGAEFSNAREFIEWLLRSIGSAQLAHEILKRYAATFNLEEGWAKRSVLYFIFVPLAFLLDSVVMVILMMIVLVLLTGVTIAILRGFDVLDELVSLYKYFF